MKRIRSVDTTPEMKVRRFLHNKGLEFQGHNTKLFMAPCFSTALSVRSFSSEVVFLTTPQAYQ